MTGEKEIVIFGPLPPPYGGVAIFDTLLGLGLGRHNIRFVHLSDESLAGIDSIKPGSVILDSFYYSLEYPEGRKIVKCLLAKFRKHLHWIKILHNGSLPERYRRYSLKQKTLFSISMNIFDRFIVVSDSLKEWLISDINVIKSVDTISSLLPIPSDYFGSNTENIHNNQNAVKIVSSVGVFTKDYGFSDIAVVIQKLRDETGTEIKFIIIDAGFTNDPEYEESVLEGKDWIKVHRQIPHSDTLRIFRDSDVFVRAVYYESYGLSRIEALLCGTPVIATNIGETRGMMVFEPGDIPALKRHLDNALFNQDSIEVRSFNSIFMEEAENNLLKFIEISR